MNKYFLSENWFIKEVSSNHWEIKKDQNKELIHQWLDNENNVINFLDLDRTLAKPIVKWLMKNQFKRERKLALLNGLLVVWLIISLIYWLTKQPVIVQAQAPQPEIVSLSWNNELSEDDQFKIELNKELEEQHESLKIDYNNLEQQLKMANNSIDKLLAEKNKLISDLEIEKQKYKLDLQEEYKWDKFDLYKSIETDFYNKKKEEYYKVWYSENFEDIKKQCKQAYLDKKAQDEKRTSDSK